MAIPDHVRPGDELSAAHTNDMLRALRQRSARGTKVTGKLLPGATGLATVDDEVGWSLWFVNVSGEDIPAYAVGEVVGYARTTAAGPNKGRMSAQVGKPRKAGLRNVGVIYRPVPRDGAGRIWFGAIHVLRLDRDADSSDGALPGQYWTTKKQSWSMQAHTMGEWMVRMVWSDADRPPDMPTASALVTARDNVDPAHAITNWHILPMAARLMDFQDSDVADFILTDNGNGIISVSTATH